MRYLLNVSIVLFALHSMWAQVDTPEVLLNPLRIELEDVTFDGYEGLMLVPENRERADSRMIAVHFMHFPAREASDLDPVVYLPGGPGGHYKWWHFEPDYGGDRSRAWTFELDVMNEKRDLLILNQRGNSRAAGFPITNFQYYFPFGKEDQPLDAQAVESDRARILDSVLHDFQTAGVDIAGYDILHLVDDIEAVRQYLEVDKVALAGTSFGSQWALAYAQQYPDRVDRMLLSGIEPLDHALDDPQGLWLVYEELARLAEADPTISENLPEVGLIAALKSIIIDLEKGPKTVILDYPEHDLQDTVLVGLDDFRSSKFYPFANSRQDELATWPQYITELYAGNYEVLALHALDVRGGRYRQMVMAELVDNSLYISPERKATLVSRPAVRWLGDVNAGAHAIQQIERLPTVTNDFRKAVPSKIPLLMIHGGLDTSTPFGNATYLQRYFANSHLITVPTGTHAAQRELILEHPDTARDYLAFMNQEWSENTEVQGFYQELPNQVDLNPIPFKFTDEVLILQALAED